jgi:UDP-N-acetylglucosamine 2-epimerase (non-hydrolysing)
MSGATEADGVGMPRTKVMVVYGTRPEVIKMAPVIRELRARPDEFSVVVCSSGQHVEMLTRLTTYFGVEPDVDARLMGAGGGLAGFMARALEMLDAVLGEHQPDIVLVQGDTSTAVAAALAAFYRQIPVGHVEAGLRTGDRMSPFPEEAHRLIVSSLSTWHFAATSLAARVLVSEGVAPEQVIVTGNTVIDALLWVGREQVDTAAPDWLPPDKRLVLVTAHRRESFGETLEGILGAVRAVADEVTDIVVAVPVHMNPVVSEVTRRVLEGHPRIVLLPPIDYPEFTQLLKRAVLVLSDSGGIQEEAPALGVPVLVLRNHTDRPEAIDVDAARLVGVDPETIRRAAVHLLMDEDARREMTVGGSPFGDGHAAARIVAALAGREVNVPGVPQSSQVPFRRS